MTSDAREWIERLRDVPGEFSPKGFIEKNLPPQTSFQKKIEELDERMMENQLKAFDLEKKNKKITSKVKFARETLIKIGGVITGHQEENNITPDFISLCEFFKQISGFTKELEKMEKSLCLEQSSLHLESSRYCQEKAVLLTVAHRGSDILSRKSHSLD